MRSLRIAITGGWIWGGWSAWVLDPARSGGHAFHNGVHLYDLARWWLGSPIASVYALGQPLTSAALAIDDYLCSTLVAESGATAVCEISRGERPRTTSLFEIVVHGDRGTLVRSNGGEGLVAYTTGGSGPRAVPGTDPFRRQLGGVRRGGRRDRSGRSRPRARGRGDGGGRGGRALRPQWRERGGGAMTTRVLLAGAGGEAAGRHHQRDMFAPAVAASELLDVVGVWPGPEDADGYARAGSLATSLDVPLVRDLDEALGGVDAVVACLDADGLELLLGSAHPGVPVLLDKPALLGTERLTALGADPRAARLVAAYHSRFHPGVTSLAAIVRSGELGLPHALHGELLVPFGDGPTAGGRPAARRRPGPGLGRSGARAAVR